MTKQEIIEKLEKQGINIVNISRVNNCGDRLDLSNKAIVNIYDNGNWNVQGKNTDSIQNILANNTSQQKTGQNNKVFVVYGHDTIARTQLEAMLRRWDLEPIILDQLPSSGNTIIEKLEEYTQKVNFGIVLATPDDKGYAIKDGDTNIKFRVRQNVVLEMGMLLAAIGRNKVAILLKTQEDFERPSDIDGLIYIPFKDDVEQAGLSLAKEMKKNEYNIDIEKL